MVHYCHVCETSQSEGMFIYYLYVCDQCQKKMIATDPEDPSYRFFIDKLRRMREQPLKN